MSRRNNIGLGNMNNSNVWIEINHYELTSENLSESSCSIPSRNMEDKNTY